MKFEIDKAVEILGRTPEVLNTMLNGLSDEWTNKNEGDNTWSPYNIIGHLIHGEKTDWIPRTQIILTKKSDKRFEPFDMKAHFESSKGKSMSDLLAEFKKLRLENLDVLNSINLSEKDFLSEGNHPEFGIVKLRQMLSSWVVHDLGHISQISRVMAKQYKDEVGPWISYLSILRK